MCGRKLSGGRTPRQRGRNSQCQSPEAGVFVCKPQGGQGFDNLPRLFNAKGRVKPLCFEQRNNMRQVLQESLRFHGHGVEERILLKTSILPQVSYTFNAFLSM